MRFLTIALSCFSLDLSSVNVWCSWSIICEKGSIIFKKRINFLDFFLKQQPPSPFHMFSFSIGRQCEDKLNRISFIHQPRQNMLKHSFEAIAWKIILVCIIYFLVTFISISGCTSAVVYLLVMHTLPLTDDTGRSVLYYCYVVTRANNTLFWFTLGIWCFWIVRAA